MIILCQYAKQISNKWQCLVTGKITKNKYEQICWLALQAKCVALQSQAAYKIGGHYAPKDEVREKTGEN